MWRYIFVFLLKAPQVRCLSGGNLDDQVKVPPGTGILRMGMNRFGRYKKMEEPR